MKTKEVLFNKDALKAIKTLFQSTHCGLVNIDQEELEYLLNCSNISVRSAVLDEATTEAVESSDVFANLKKNANNYLLIITGGLSLSLEMIDTICLATREHIKSTDFTFATICDESQKNKIKLDLFIMS